MSDRDGHIGEVRALAEAVADVLEERGLIVATMQADTRALNVADVAALLGRSKPWVYEHAAELGAFRYGNGPKARIGFDRGVIERWKRDRQVRQPAAQQPRPTTRPRRHASASPSSVSLIPYDPVPYRA